MKGDKEVFAFGDNMIQDTACPVLTVTGVTPGKQLESKLLTVAEKYDEIVRQRYGLDEGTLPASVAESCWNEAVENLLADSEYYLGRDNEHSEYLHDAATEGKALAERAFC
jgi:hypothetical protein